MRQNMEELQATQEEMERSQRDTEAREKILNDTQCIIEFDKNGRITTINQLACNCTGYGAHELEGSALEHIFNATSRADQMKAQLASQQIWKGTAQLKTKSGELISVRAVAGTILDHKGSVSKHLLILEDVRDLQLRS
jgi:PAS domain S-box-containing protein